MNVGWLILGAALADEVDEDASGSWVSALPRLPADIPAAATVVPPGVDAASDDLPARVGAASLGLSVAYVEQVRAGLDALYRRDYPAARLQFQQMESASPGLGLDAVADVLVYQALMFEGYDFRYDRMYKTASARARRMLEASLSKPGDEAWEHFLACGVVGIESMDAVRKEQYVSGLTLAFEAMDHATAARVAAPALPDLLLADGIYNYWRTAVTESSKVLPRFGDHRVEGVAQMKAVERSGVFLGPVATLTLVFTWAEERDLDRALAAAELNHSRYPDNVINGLVYGRTLTNLRRFEDAIEVYARVGRVAPENRLVPYYRGVAELRSGQLDAAERSLGAFLAFPDLERWQLSYGWYRLGQLRYKQRRYDEAERAWVDAVRLDGNRLAKARLERLRAARRAGTLPA